jgi:hypothetical protein
MTQSQQQANVKMDHLLTVENQKASCNPGQNHHTQRIPSILGDWLVRPFDMQHVTSSCIDHIGWKVHYLRQYAHHHVHHIDSGMEKGPSCWKRLGLLIGGHHLLCPLSHSRQIIQSSAS